MLMFGILELTFVKLATVVLFGLGSRGLRRAYFSRGAFWDSAAFSML
jgi:hypothetical protein